MGTGLSFLLFGVKEISFINQNFEEESFRPCRGTFNRQLAIQSISGVRDWFRMSDILPEWEIHK